ncbi:transcription factor [Colletotrichum truncatum]|uniref:Transcription factor n=1 Tax=Colletotrichum truncatum TaxID=5467 RepID=A0ACC3YU88_COLTU
MEKNNVKRISCKRCQQRKIRCSRTFPCGNCSVASVKCEFRESDFKRPPVSREYVAALESRIALLDGFLARLKEASNSERDKILDEVQVKDYVPSFSGLPLEDEAALSEAFTKASLQETTDGSMIYHGPTSIFQNDVGDAYANSSVNSKPSLFHEKKSNLTHQTMRLCLGLFFMWQYPLFMFIDREAFISEFEENPVDGDFCSPPLIYSAAAIGALMSKDPEIRAKADAYNANAQNILMNEGLNAPRPTSVQALLCCAYYEVGRGNISRGWLLSGMAFRMGQDIGFQRDPTHWESEEKPKSALPFAFDNEFRRRIYWGCFLSDKIFSLLLGRPTIMHESDADVNLSEPLPNDPPIWEDWLQSHDLEFLKPLRPAGPKLTLVFNQQIELARIIHDMLSTTFAPKKKNDVHSRKWTEVSLNKLNARLVAWHEALPADMRWKKWFTNKDVLHPSVALLHTLYHSIRICLNLPFIASIGNMPSLSEEKPEGTEDPLFDSFRRCKASAEGIIDILQRFKGQHTLGNAPLLFLGGALLSMNAILVICRHEGSNQPSSMRDTLLPILGDAMQEMGPSWTLSEAARLRFKSLFTPNHHHGSSPSSKPGRETAGSQSSPDLSLHKDLTTTTSTLAGTQSRSVSSGNQPVITPDEEPLGGLGSTAHHINDLENPIQHLWEPMGVLDEEAAYWANVGNDFLVDSDLSFLDSLPEFDLSDQPPMP